MADGNWEYEMKRTMKIGLTALFVPGMLVLGAVSGLFLAVMPWLTGLTAALAALAFLALGAAAGVLGVCAFCGGMALSLWLLEPGMLALAPWFGLFLGLALALICGQLRAGVSAGRAMVFTGAGLFAFGAVSYIAGNLVTGDLIARVTDMLSAELAQMSGLMPQLYDLLLSMLSLNGMLPDVELTQPVLELDAQTRAVLTASLIELYDSSLRLSLMQILMQQALHTAFLGVLLPLLELGGKPEAPATPLPDLTAARIPAKPAVLIMLALILSWVWMLFDTSAYAAYLAVWSAVKFVYAMQGLSLAQWFMKKHDWAGVLRALILCAAYLLLQDILLLLGVAEQFFCFRGLGRPGLRSDGRDGDDNENNDLY